MSSFAPIANPWIHQLDRYEPGRPIEEVARELGLGDPEEIIKLASNENALGPSPRAVQAMAAAASTMHLYPDGNAFYLRRALAEKLGVQSEEILVGNGSNEILELLGHVFLGPGTNIVMADRAFLVYRLVADLCRADTVAVPMKSFVHDLDAMRDAIDERTRLVFIGNPNNPTGTMMSETDLDRFIRRVPPHLAVVLDEAYIELLPPARQPDTLKFVREGKNVFILRTFSKTYGLAGLRLGYAVAPREGVELLQRVRQPFNVNAMAQSAALGALQDEEYVERTRVMIREGLAFLERELNRLGLSFVPSVANFILVQVGQGRQIFEALLRKKVIVRAMDGYGLPEYVRITVGTREQNEVLIRSLKEVLGKSHKGIDG